MGIGQQILNGTYSLDNRPLTAYEELKAWCEKHLPDRVWGINNYSGEKCVVIRCYDGEVSINFDESGDYNHIELDTQRLTPP